MADYMPPEVASVMGLVDTYNRWKNANGGPRGYERYHPSAFGRCLRLMQYQRYVERGYMEQPQTEETEAFMIRVWDNGHGIHNRWRGYFTDLGVLRGYWRCLNEFCNGGKPIWHGTDQLQGCFKPDKCDCGGTQFEYEEVLVKDKELNFHGHADAILDFSNFDPTKLKGIKHSFLHEYLPKGLVVVDFKSINMFDFQEIKGEPHPYYRVQLMIYANILQCDYGILIYENKNNQKTCAFKIEKDGFDTVRAQAKKMNEMVEVEHEGQMYHLLPPPRPMNKADKECDAGSWHCPFKDICHNSSIWDDPELDKMRSDFYGELL